MSNSNFVLRGLEGLALQSWFIRQVSLGSIAINIPMGNWKTLNWDTFKVGLILSPIFETI